MLDKPKNLAKQIYDKLQRIKIQHVVVAAGSLPAIAVMSYFIIFFWPKNVAYAYNLEKTCFKNPTFLPNAINKTNGSNYEISRDVSFTIAGYPIFSNNSCAKITGVPAENYTEQITFEPLANPVFSQKINIHSKEMPKLVSNLKEGELTSTQEVLELRLNQSDKTFDYRITAGEKSANCSVENDQLKCSLADLKLAQSKQYKLKFTRLLKDKEIGTVFEATIKTVDPVTVTEQSIAPGSTVYDSPGEIILTANKPIKSYDGIELKNAANEGGANSPAEVSIDKNKIIIKPGTPLTRESTYRLSIKNLEAIDKGFLAKPYVLEFNTSGGPKVAGANIGSYGVSPSSQIILSFDYELLPGQNIAGLFSIQTAGGTLPFSAEISGRSVIINPNPILPRCTPFTIRLVPGIKNIHSIASSTPWSYSSRTICQEVFSIGVSVQGRSITAYKFGSGPSAVIYIGATHGDEIGSKYLLDSWVNELEANFNLVPAHRTIIVIPMLNPDGVAASTRTNSQNVDLNRNFPANNWKADVIMPAGNLVAGGGGTSALSEPESNAIASYITAMNPRLVMTYHSKGSLVVANEAGDSGILASMYGSGSGYMATTESQLGNTFQYDTTGAMENWLYDKPKIPALLVELTTHSYNEFYKNKSAMWQMAKL